jgi:hypothetical protein
MRMGDAETYKVDGPTTFVIDARHGKQALSWAAFVIFAVFSAGCSQTIAADALVHSFKRNVIATGYAQTNPLAEQLLQMAQILQEQARADEAIRLQTVTMSQARIDALLLKNSIEHMVSSLDRYRAFFRSFHR